MKDLFQIDSNEIHSVSELTKEIKNLLEPSFRSRWVKGEISNLRSQQSGHFYFSLKDSQSQIPCVFFSRYANNSECLLEDGAEVFLFGDLSIYEPYGRYQFNVKLAQASGKGNLHILFEKLKKKLYDEGLFDSTHKQPIPKIPKKIALITSPTGAAIQDFLRILKRRKFSGVIDLLPTQVQGKQAHLEIIKAIEYASIKEHDYDLIILMRGGGSIEDLWSFNEESLARSLYKCTIPSISAIGHEIDTVLTDLVSDFRAETPSAAAELISSNFIESKNTYTKYREFLIKQKTDTLFYLKEHLINTSKKLALLKPQNLIDKRMMHLDVLEKKLAQKLNTAIQLKNESVAKLLSKLSEHHPKQKLKANISHLEIRQHQFIQLKNSALKTKTTDVSNLKHRLDNSSIQSSLKRGYVLLKNENQKVLSSYEDAKKESIIHAQFHDGNLKMKKNS
jgi:exodeoxyribonuclease VII large subunit